MSGSQVSDFVSGLKSRHADIRHRTIRELMHFVKTDLREMSQDGLELILDEFNQQIHALTSSYDNLEKKAGILIIVCLIGGDTETTKTRTTRYSLYLKSIFPTTDIGVLELAAKTMGRLASTLGIKKSEYVELEIKKCYEWLSEERNEAKRLSAVFVLRELAIAVPSYFFQNIAGFFSNIIVALRDPKEQIREAAAKTLRAALVVTAQREVTQQGNKVTWYSDCYEEAMTSFTDQPSREKGLNRDEHVQGALLILNELVRCSNATWEKKYTMLMQKLDAEQETSDEISSINEKVQHTYHSQHYPEEKNETTYIYESAICRNLVLEKYEKICSEVMAQQISRSNSVHQMLLLLIPRLAAFNREAFASKHLKSTINHLITFLRGREKERAMAFTTLGLLCVAVEDDIQIHLNRIIEIIKQTLPVKDTPKKRNGSDASLFNCITLLGFAMKENVADEVKELLDPMCATGLSPQLTTCFKELSQNLPTLKKEITDRLLNMLSLILRKRPYTPHNGEQQIVQMMSNVLLEPHDANKLILALKTLGSFDFEWNNTLMSFIRRCTDHYLLSEQHDLRMEAVKTASRLLIKAIDRSAQTNSRTLNLLVDESLGKILSVGRADFDHEVRYRVLEIFTNPVFDKYLAVEEHLNCLFVSIHDSNSDVGELALCVVGRLSNLNPSFTTPTLRQMFVQILMELQHSESARNKEQALKMINNIISHAPRITRQFVDIILKVLVPKLREEESNSTMVTTILKSIGDLAEINGGGYALKQWLPELMSVQLSILSDPNQQEKRSVALWSFGQVVTATGHVVSPYMEHPQLMDMLLNSLKTEQQTRDRREIIRVLGLLGALDPYKHKVNQGLIDFQTISTLIPVAEDSCSDHFDTNIMLVNMSPLVLDEFYPAIVVTSLMKMLRDPMLTQYHGSVVHSVTFIFQSLGIKCVPYISRVTPTLLNTIRTAEKTNFREILLVQLAQLISIVKTHIRNYLDDIIELIKEYWTTDSSLQPTLIMLVEHITLAIGSEFKIYLRKILPNILRVLRYDRSKDKLLTEMLLLTIQKFENNLDDVLMSIVPAITGLFDGKHVPISVSKVALETIAHLCMFLNFKPFSAAIIQAIARVLENNPALRPIAMNTLCALIVQLGRDYLDYIPSVDRIMVKHKIQCANYVVLVSRLQVVSTLAFDDDYLEETRAQLRNQKNELLAPESQPIQKLTVNTLNLRRSWSTQNLISKEDWLEWLRHLSVTFVTESNSPAIRACSSLAQNYPQLASDLFNAAFMSCWTDLDENSRRELVVALEKALAVPDAPELALAVLNLAEFLEHCEKGVLPISTKLLGDTAINCRAYAKALYYKEEEFKYNSSKQVVEALIHINNKLQQKEAATGLLDNIISQKKNCDFSLNVHVRWYEKLHNWDQALDLYSKKLEVEPKDDESRLGMMRCLEAMGEWRKLYTVTTDQWDNMSTDIKKQCAKMAAAASWGLQEWESMKKFVDRIPGESQESSLYRAIIAIHEGQWSESRHYIDTARSLLDTELSAVAGESYQRAYGSLVNAQLLTELEEVVTYKLVEERRPTIRNTWWARLQGGQRLVEDWRKMLQVRSLVLTPREDFQTWLKFASLCRKTGAIHQAHKIVISILGSDPASNPDILLKIQDPRLILSYSKNLWDAGNKRFAYDVLQRFVDNADADTDETEHCRLLARCHLKLGSWCESLQEINELSIPEILRNYAAAAILAPDWYKACHAWACMNFETVLFYKQQDNVSENSVAGVSGEKKVSRADFMNTHTIPAITGFFNSISLSNGSALQNTLRILTLWFDHGHYPPVYDALFEGIRQIDIKIWLQVIPQLIARIDSPRNLVAKLVHILLIDIGKQHPQALVYPLTVATKSSFVTRKNAANYILRTMCTHSQNLVDEAAVISEELIKVAILWHDQVFIALDEASRLYYSEKDYRSMFKTLERMHQMLDKEPETLKEVSFLQMYGRDLQEAQRWCDVYKETGEDRYLNVAWDLYYHVFRRISSQFRLLHSLELQYVSKHLDKCRDFELAVPGSYVPNEKLIRISYIHSQLQVIKSKQRPRRLTIQGSDGKQYMFLLKGHEDLRQDERVMQLFGLVNTLLQADTTTYRHDLAIQRYAVIPLSPNTGLIGWVPQCDTLYNLISDHREKKSNKLALNTEQQIMLKMASEYPKLMLMHKVEVFEYTLSQTPGNDLARLLWLKSPSAEAWFERRTNYTRSLAVMSMVGYILGLGDRHPSNIMLHRVTGKVLHIDFGDCFEVTQTREKLPEKIPFRLTRMLINAMEVTGIEGTYRSTCESVMHVLHKHRDSVMAVLEAFVYDPLLNWRLIDNERFSLTESSFSSNLDSSYTLPSRSRNHLHYESVEIPPEANLNKRALAILNRIRDKLTGRDFPQVEAVVSVPKQVELLIKMATSTENLCQCYIGWCPYW